MQALAAPLRGQPVAIWRCGSCSVERFRLLVQSLQETMRGVEYKDVWVSLKEIRVDNGSRHVRFQFSEFGKYAFHPILVRVITIRVYSTLCLRIGRRIMKTDRQSGKVIKNTNSQGCLAHPRFSTCPDGKIE